MTIVTCQVNTKGISSAARDENKFWRLKELRPESPLTIQVRLIQEGENLEAVSFKVSEEALIEDNVELYQGKDIIWARLPFVEDPVANLKPNRFDAEQVLKTQLELFRKHER